MKTLPIIILLLLVFHGVIISQEINLEKILKSQKRFIDKNLNGDKKYEFNFMFTSIGFLKQSLQNKLNEFIIMKNGDSDTIYLLMAYDLVTADLYLRIWDKDKKSVFFSRMVPKGNITYDLILEESENESFFSDVKHIILDFESDFELIVKAQTIIDGGLYFTGSYLIFKKSRTIIKSIAFTQY